MSRTARFTLWVSAAALWAVTIAAADDAAFPARLFLILLGVALVASNTALHATIVTARIDRMYGQMLRMAGRPLPPRSPDIAKVARFPRQVG